MFSPPRMICERGQGGFASAEAELTISFARSEMYRKPSWSRCPISPLRKVSASRFARERKGTNDWNHPSCEKASAVALGLFQ